MLDGNYDPATDLTPVYQAAGQRYGIDPDLLRAQTRVESSDNDYAISPAGAMGRSQFIGSTAAAEGLNDPGDPHESIPAQAKLLREHADKFGSMTHAIGAYHSGSGNPSEWGPATNGYLDAMEAEYGRIKAQAPAPQPQQQQAPSITDQIATARKSGYSDGEIATYLQQSHTWAPKFDAARKAGYLDADIFQHFGLKVPEGTPLTSKQAVKQLPMAQQETPSPNAGPPPPHDTGWLDAITQGLGSGIRGGAQTVQALTGGKPVASEPTIAAAQPIEWGDIHNPGLLGRKFLYGIAASSPQIAGFTAGAALAGGPETPVGLAAGAAGAAIADAATTLGPAFGNELKATPQDPDGAYTRALKQTGVGAAFTGLGFAAFGVNPFEGTLKNIVFQAFGVQPAVAVAQRGTQNVMEGKPVGEDIFQPVPGAIAMTAAPLLAHAAARRVMGRTQTPQEAAPAAAGVGPPSAVPTTGTPAPEPTVAPPRAGRTLEEEALSELNPEWSKPGLRERPQYGPPAPVAAEAHAELEQIAQGASPPPPEQPALPAWEKPGLNELERFGPPTPPWETPALRELERFGPPTPPWQKPGLNELEQAGPPTPPWQRPGLTERERLGPPEGWADMQESQPDPADWRRIVAETATGNKRALTWWPERGIWRDNTRDQNPDMRMFTRWMPLERAETEAPPEAAPPITPLQERHAQVSAAEAERSQAAEKLPFALPGEDEWQAHLAQFQKKLDAAQSLADAGKPMRFSDPRYPHLSYLVSPEMHEGYPAGHWRVTTFSNGEPFGHMEANTAFDAFKEATTHNWQPIERSRAAEAARDVAQPSAETRAPPRIRTVEQIQAEDGIGPKKAQAVQMEEIAAIGRPITPEEMAARRAGVAQPKKQAADPRLAGLPEGSSIIEGRGPLGRDKVGIGLNGRLIANLHPTVEAAVKEAREFLGRADRAEAEVARQKAAFSDIAERLRAGSTITDSDLKSLGLKSGSARFDYLSPAVQNLFGIGKPKVREAMGDALKKRISDFGTETWWADPRKALSNAAAYAERKGITPKPGAAASGNLRTPDNLYTFPGALFDPEAWRRAFGNTAPNAPEEVLRDKEGIARASAEIRAGFAPTSLRGAKPMEYAIRQHTSESAQAHDIEVHKLEVARQATDRLSQQEQVMFSHRMETGQRQPTPELQRVADLLREALDRWAGKIQGLGKGYLANAIEDYMGHIWGNYREWSQGNGAPARTQAQMQGAATATNVRKQPLRGSGNFLKQRSFPTQLEGINAGLVPVTYNPVDLQLIKLHEMQKFYHGTTLADAIKTQGIAHWVRDSDARDAMQRGEVPLDDKIFQPKLYGVTPIGPVEPGKWYAPEPAARVFNNYMSQGWANNSRIYDALRQANNGLNTLQLGIGGFHAAFVTNDVATSKVALGLQQIARGELGRGGANLLFGTPVLGHAAALTDSLRKGGQVRREWLDPGSGSPDVQRVVNAIKAGGYRMTMPDFFRSSTAGPFFKNWNDLKNPGSVWRQAQQMFRDAPTPFQKAIMTPIRIAARTLDTTMEPLMGALVPRAKAGVMYDLAADWLRRNPNATPQELSSAMTKFQDSVDNRLGQLNYDNLFWNKTLKDVAFITTRSVGWNLGTFRELGGAVADSPKFFADAARGRFPQLTTRMAYAMAMPVVTGMLGAVLTYMATGQGPQSLLDYFYPPTGTDTNQGVQERRSIPGYMKDVFAFGHDPVQTVLNKASPMIEAVNEIRQNRDYYGGIIWNPERDRGPAQAYGDFLINQATPFSLRSWGRLQGEGAPALDQALGFFGFQPAPASITNPERGARFQRKEMTRATKLREKEVSRGLSMHIFNTPTGAAP